jgi:hypothetical protein
MKPKTLFLFILLSYQSMAQDYRWQQRVEYNMDVKIDVLAHKVTGTQRLTYYNNSRDTLNKVFYHLFFNAFQPGSMMDIRALNIADTDPRMGDRISKLKDNEIGYQHIQSLKQDGKEVGHTTNGTILEVILSKPILPGGKTVFDITFESQIPLQIRRSGRNSKEGVAYSMTQWYPKMAEYDHLGWHPYQYIAREFHGVWGDFDVKITIDKTYVLGGTGKLQNADKIGYGYEKPGSTVKRQEGNDLTWHFVAKNVHDFAWAADPDYTHDVVQVPNGPELHFLYQKGDKTTENWSKLQALSIQMFDFMNKTFGKYPYELYSVIQGGDGGMEYPMCTLILGEKSLGSLVGTAFHEIAHSWYQGVLASNEALYPWMDEGFADFASNEALGAILQEQNVHYGSYAGYFALMKNNTLEPASQHADHFNINRAYSVASYGVGAVLLEQLKYIIGADTFYPAMRLYYDTWKFKHPEPADFIRIMEKKSNMQLKWFMSYSINTTKRIDYGIKNVLDNGAETFVSLERIGDFPMPVDLYVTYKDGTKEIFYIPLNEMLGNKSVEDKNIPRNDLEPWQWVNPNYVVKINRRSSEIASIEIDSTLRLADVERRNNKIDLSATLKASENRTK